MQLKPWLTLISPFHTTITSPCTAFHVPLLQPYLTWVIMIVFTPGAHRPTLSDFPLSPLNLTCAGLCILFLSFVSLLIPEHFFSCLIEPAVKVTAMSPASCEDGSWHPKLVLRTVNTSQSRGALRGARPQNRQLQHPSALTQLSGTSRARDVPAPMPWAIPHLSSSMLPPPVRQINARDRGNRERLNNYDNYFCLSFFLLFLDLKLLNFQNNSFPLCYPHSPSFYPTALSRISQLLCPFPAGLSLVLWLNHHFDLTFSWGKWFQFEIILLRNMDCLLKDYSVLPFGCNITLGTFILFP